MVKTTREIDMIIREYKDELHKLGITTARIVLFGSYRNGTPREDSDIDLLVISNDFARMNLRERLELLGVAAGRVFEPIAALGYTPEEIEEKEGTFIEEILTG